MNNQKVRVRFAPSPTGYLHIGGARTALFNYLFARKMGGDFLLRIEDTDKARSTEAAIAAIFDGLNWLGLSPDEPPVMQSARLARHQEVVKQMLGSGAAYNCYMSAAELAENRAKAAANNEIYRYDGTWRDRPASDAPAGVAPSIRLKAPRSGAITINDHVLGEVSVDCAELDDMVLMRSDGTPTYLLAVVVDDHDMGITHIIRGDDHFTNSFRQALIYNALGWNIPEMAHLPLIHGSDGAKLSKRHGAMGVDSYRDELGYLPEAIRNYLLRLGWAHGDAEIISDAEAINLFSFDGLGKSPARFDFAKLDSINAHYIRAADLDNILELSKPYLTKLLGAELNAQQQDMLKIILPELQMRASTLNEIASGALFLFKSPTEYSEKAAAFLNKAKDILPELYANIQTWQDFNHDSIQEYCNIFAKSHGLKLGEIMNPLRASITGSHASPSMFHIIPLLGKAEILTRLSKLL
jgi:glutamyl-tRNA synthetase